MVPLLSKRSITVMVIGLMVGIGLGLGYWIISPSFAASNSQSDSQAQISGLPAMLGLVPDEPWTSTASIQVVSAGSADVSLTELAAKGQSYIVKLQSLPFLGFLQQSIDKQMPQYSYTIEQLDQMIEAGYDTKSAVPTLKVKVTASTIEETTFLSGFIPETFQNFLATQAAAMAQQETNDILAEIDNIKAAGHEAKQELDTLVQKQAERDLSNNPTHVATTAKISALEIELGRQASDLVTIITQGVASGDVETQLQSYGATPQEQGKSLEASLAEVQQQLKALDLERTINNTSITNDPIYIMLNAKVEALQATLNDQAGAMAAVIARGDTTSTQAVNAQSALVNLGVAISETKKELAILEAQAAAYQPGADLNYESVKDTVTDLKQKQSYLEAQKRFEATSAALAMYRQALVAAGNGNALENDVEYQAAKSKVNSLNAQLALLNGEMGSSMVNGPKGSTTAITLATEIPSVPVPVLPNRAKARNVLMMGAIVGVGGSWFVLNRRWFSSGMAQQPVEEDEEIA